MDPPQVDGSSRPLNSNTDTTTGNQASSQPSAFAHPPTMAPTQSGASPGSPTPQGPVQHSFPHPAPPPAVAPHVIHHAAGFNTYPFGFPGYYSTPVPIPALQQPDLAAIQNAAYTAYLGMNGISNRAVENSEAEYRRLFMEALAAQFQQQPPPPMAHQPVINITYNVFNTQPVPHEYPMVVPNIYPGQQQGFPPAPDLPPQAVPSGVVPQNRSTNQGVSEPPTIAQNQNLTTAPSTITTLPGSGLENPPVLFATTSQQLGKNDFSVAPVKPIHGPTGILGLSKSADHMENYEMETESDAVGRSREQMDKTFETLRKIEGDENSRKRKIEGKNAAAVKKSMPDVESSIEKRNEEPLEENEKMDQDEQDSDAENQPDSDGESEEQVLQSKKTNSNSRGQPEISLPAQASRDELKTERRQSIHGFPLSLAALPSTGRSGALPNPTHSTNVDASIFGEIAALADTELIYLIPALKDRSESMKNKTDVRIYKEIHLVFEEFIRTQKLKVWKDKVYKAYDVAKQLLKERGYCCGEGRKLTIPNIECDYPRAYGCRIRENKKFYSKSDGEKTIDWCADHYNRAKKQKKNCEEEIHVNWKDMEEERHVSTRMEKLEECTICHKRWHEACRMSQIWENAGAAVCRRTNDIDKMISSKDLEVCDLSTFIENGLDSFVKGTGKHCPHITIRVTSVRKSEFRVGENLKKYCQKKGDNISDIDYSTKCVIAFQDVEVRKESIIFGMIAQEYEATGFANVEWVDSNHYIGTDIERQLIFQQIISEYLKFTRLSGFNHAFICACPAPRQDDYLFNAHHPKQTYAKQEKLDEFYRTILDSLGKDVIKNYGNQFVRDQMSKDLKGTLKAVQFFNCWTGNIETILEELIKKMSLNVPDFDDLFMKKLSELEASNEHHLIYITFAELTQDEIPKQKKSPIKESQHLGTQIGILQTQRELGLEFKTLEKAVYATKKLVQIWKAKEDEKEANLFGPNIWFHQ